MAKKEQNLLKRFWKFVKGHVAKVKGDPSFKSLEQDLEYLDNYIEKLLNSKETNIDKSNGNDVKYYKSRANKQGELINEFYNALDNNEWRGFYSYISENGDLSKTEIGDLAVVPTGNKIVIAERQMTGKDAHDFQAIDVFEFVGDFSFDIPNIMDLLKERGIDYGEKQIRNAILGYARIVGQEKSIRRYDKYNMRYGSSVSWEESKLGKYDNRNDVNPERRLNGKTNNSSSERDLQKVSNELNTDKEASDEGAFSMPKEDSAGNELSKQQQEYFKNSKVLDKNGNLKVMRHGTNAEFTVFEKKYSKGSNLYGRGFYFTDSESHSSQYGNSKEYYIDIQNPLSQNTKTISKDQLKKFVLEIANKLLHNEKTKTTIKHSFYWQTIRYL